MSTNKPRVQGYISPTVLDRLNEFRDAHSLKSNSEALALALEDYFGIKQSCSDSVVSASGSLRLDKLEMQVESLTEGLSRVTKVLADLGSNPLVTQSQSQRNPLVSQSESPRIEQVPLDNLGDSSKPVWSIYLHHPRGTVECIAGPFPDVEQAQQEMNSQKGFGLFPEAKGYSWECREEGTATAQQQKVSELANTEATKGLKLMEVAAQLGRNYSSLRMKRAELGTEGFLKFLHTETGHPWRFDPAAHRYGLYYPT